jgi:hypothetical protein
MSVKIRRSVSRLDPQIDTWSSSSVTLFLSSVIAGWVMSKRSSVANDKRQQIGVLRLGIRALLKSNEEIGIVR